MATRKTTDDHPQAEEPTCAQDQPQAQEQETRPERVTYIVNGRRVDPDGKPVG